MATMVFTSSWILEDDLLLKNSIEAGASLEALAKGAVQFSRKYTFQELWDRWRSLLYDPEISAEVSTRITEYESSASNQSSKSNMSGTSKSLLVCGKKKLGSIYHQYCAMRKKNYRECFNSTDSTLFDALKIHDATCNIGVCPQYLTSDNKSPIGSMSDHLGFHDVFEITHHLIPQIRSDFAVSNALRDSANTTQSGQDNYPNELMRKDGLLELHVDVPPFPMQESELNDSRHYFDQKEFQYIRPDNLVELTNCSDVEKLVQSQALPDRIMFRNDNHGTIPLSDSVLLNPKLGNLSHGFDRRNQSIPPVSDSMSSWKKIEDSPTIEVKNIGLGDNVQDVERTLPPAGGDDEVNKLSCNNIIHSGVMIRDIHPDVINDSTSIPKDDFVDISDSLLNFENEDELLFIDAGVNDKVDKSFDSKTNSTVVCFPSDDHDDERKASARLIDYACCDTPGDGEGVCQDESEHFCDASHSISRRQNMSCYSEDNVPKYTLMPNTHSTELCDEDMYCRLNSEDLDIPENDKNVFLTDPLVPYASLMNPEFKEVSDPCSTLYNEQCFGNKRHCLAKSLRASEVIGFNPFSKICATNRRIDSEFKPSKMGLGVVSKFLEHVDSDDQASNKSNEIQAIINSTMHGGEFNYEKNDPLTIIGEHHPVHVEQTWNKKAFTIEDGNPLETSQEECESDLDIPYFADIEALILDMDLTPCDQDSCIFEKVSRYQSDDAKRKIMRLEQCFHSSLLRTISSQGAFAILYGRHVKYYIKKSEIILGRRTDDIDVDVDLGIEGRANKISRRQAIIKLEGNGCFLLKNLGKNSIFVNGREVSIGRILILSSSCLIEIREMSFVFEVNLKSVRQYIANLHINKEKKSKFEWSPEGVP